MAGTANPRPGEVARNAIRDDDGRLLGWAVLTVRASHDPEAKNEPRWHFDREEDTPMIAVYPSRSFLQLREEVLAAVEEAADRLAAQDEERLAEEGAATSPDGLPDDDPDLRPAPELHCPEKPECLTCGCNEGLATHEED